MAGPYKDLCITATDVYRRHEEEVLQAMKRNEEMVRKELMMRPQVILNPSGKLEVEVLEGTKDWRPTVVIPVKRKVLLLLKK